MGPIQQPVVNHSHLYAQGRLELKGPHDYPWTPNDPNTTPMRLEKEPPWVHIPNLHYVPTNWKPEKHRVKFSPNPNAVLRLLEKVHSPLDELCYAKT